MRPLDNMNTATTIDTPHYTPTTKVCDWASVNLSETEAEKPWTHYKPNEIVPREKCIQQMTPDVEDLLTHCMTLDEMMPLILEDARRIYRKIHNK